MPAGAETFFFRVFFWSAGFAFAPMKWLS